MKYHHPLKKILSQARPYWDRDEMRPSVRWAFGKAWQCRTPELGAEVYASEKGERTFYHTCKSRPCSSCGYRAVVQWQRGWWAALPDALYKGITFTMPDVLWSLFRDNPLVAKALPALAAEVIKARISAKYGLRVGVIAILHTFNGKLEFNSHVHTMVTGGGMYGSSDTWVSRAYHERDLLMEAWRRAVIALIRAALRAGRLCTKMTADQIEEMLTEQENRSWSIKIQSFKSKEHFLRYAGRYVRRPPIAQRRITYIGKQDRRDAYRAGESLVEHQDSILQVERAFPAIRRSVRKAATHCAAPHHLHWEADRQVLVQRQEAASPGLRTVFPGRVH